MQYHSNTRSRLRQQLALLDTFHELETVKLLQEVALLKRRFARLQKGKLLQVQPTI